MLSASFLLHYILISCSWSSYIHLIIFYIFSLWGNIVLPCQVSFLYFPVSVPPFPFSPFNTIWLSTVLFYEKVTYFYFLSYIYLILFLISFIIRKCCLLLVLFFIVACSFFSLLSHSPYSVSSLALWCSPSPTPQALPPSSWTPQHCRGMLERGLSGTGLCPQKTHIWKLGLTASQNMTVFQDGPLGNWLVKGGHLLTLEACNLCPSKMERQEHVHGGKTMWRHRRNMAIYSSRLALGRNSPAKDLISGSGLWDSVKMFLLSESLGLWQFVLTGTVQGQSLLLFLRSWLLFCYLCHSACTQGADRVPSTIFCWL